MANYWDTFKPGLLAGEDYWEDFTADAPTQTGIVGAVTGKRYQPWEKGYHNIAGLVDDSGQYDAWYDPDPPPETSVPDLATPEGFDKWKDRIALEASSTTNNNSGVHLPEGGSGDPTHQSWTLGTNKQNLHDSWGGTPWQDIPGLSKLGESLGWNKVANAPITDDTTSSSSFSWDNVKGIAGLAIAVTTGSPLAMALAASNKSIQDIVSSVLDLSTDDTESTGEVLSEEDAMDAASVGQTDGSYSAL